MEKTESQTEKQEFYADAITKCMKFATEDKENSDKLFIAIRKALYNLIKKPQLNQHNIFEVKK